MITPRTLNFRVIKTAALGRVTFNALFDDKSAEFSVGYVLEQRTRPGLGMETVSRVVREFDLKAVKQPTQEQLRSVIEFVTGRLVVDLAVSEGKCTVTYRN